MFSYAKSSALFPETGFLLELPGRMIQSVLTDQRKNSTFHRKHALMIPPVLKKVSWVPLITNLSFLFSMAVIVIYLGEVNFRLPFMTRDEWSHVYTTFWDMQKDVVNDGRISHVLGFSVSWALAFVNPVPSQLIPRYLSMLAVLGATSWALKRLGFTWKQAFLIGGFAITSHQVGWQHNGLVSFYGTYNAFLACFIGAMYLNEKASPGPIRAVLGVFLLICSFSSELFVGLAASYLVLAWILGVKERIFRSSFFYALFLYVGSFLTLQIFVKTSHRTAGMKDYLYGSVNRYQPIDLLYGLLQYFVNAFPHWNRLHVDDKKSAILGAVVLLVLLAWLIPWFVRGIQSRRTVEDAVVVSNKKLQILLILLMVSVVPCLLLVMQPLKLSWVLGSSKRYVFSYYTWAGFVMVAAYFVKYVIYPYFSRSVSKVVTVALVVGLTVFMVKAGQHNIRFVKEYKISQQRWVELNELLEKNRSKKLVVPFKYITHPYITIISSYELARYAKLNYDVDLHVCAAPGQGLTATDMGIFAHIAGFSGPEDHGRWTDGDQATIVFDKAPKINFISVYVTKYYYNNTSVELEVTSNGQVHKFNIEGSGAHDFAIPEAPPGPLEFRFILPHANSPAELGHGYDPRRLGMMLKNIRYAYKRPDGTEISYDFCQ